MLKLPPYGRSIDNSSDLIWIWAGHSSRVYASVKAWGKNTCAFFTWLDPLSYFWPVQGRDVLIVHSMAPRDIWIERLAFALLIAKAKRVTEIHWFPNCPALGAPELIITHYQKD